MFCFTEKNKKRDIRNWYQSANDRYNDAIEEKPRDTLRRGDIPILHGDCDGKRHQSARVCFFFFGHKFGQFFFLVLLHLNECYWMLFLSYRPSSTRINAPFLT